jgi:hypothetical protein
MVWALLALLGVPIWLIIGALFVVVRRRRRFLRTPDVFPCRLRLRAGRLEGLGEGWGRRVDAYWVHDVLLVGRGPARARSWALPVETPRDGVRSVAGVKHLGPDPVALSLSLDDGTVVDVAAPASAAALLTGPYLAARPEFTVRPEP